MEREGWRKKERAIEGENGRAKERQSERASVCVCVCERPGVVAEESRALEFVPLSLSIPATLALIALLRTHPQQCEDTYSAV